MKSCFSSTLLLLGFIQCMYSQDLLDRFIDKIDSHRTQNDSIIASGIYDTLINNIKLKIISLYPADITPYPIAYYGRLQFKAGNLVGTYISANEFGPRYIYEYRNDGTQLTEGTYCGQQCAIGSKITYFSNGKKSKTFNGIIDPKKEKGESQYIANGKETFYNKDGDSLLSKFWNNGKLDKQVPYNINISGNVQFLLDNTVLLINDSIKLIYFDKIKLQPDNKTNSELLNGFTASIEIWQNKKYSSLRIDDLKDFKNIELARHLKKHKFNFRKNLNMLVSITEHQSGEMLETHFLSFVQ